MKNKIKHIAITIIIVSILLIAWSFTTIQGSQRTYEVRPEIDISDYQSDHTRLINAYEELMNRYMDLVEKNLTSIDQDVKNSANTLGSIDKKLDNLSERFQRIEKALNIEESQGPINQENHA